MELWTLIENTACREDLQAEHGLSLFLQWNGHRILFDAGQTDAFARNADAMGIDLAAAELAVLSHGHYDHSGGLRQFLQINDHAPVYLSRRAFGCHRNAEDRYIGLDLALQGSDRLIFTDDRLEILPGMTLYSCNGKEKSRPTDSFGLTVWEQGVLRPDDFLHEQYLLLEEDGKRILISGCSHKGILNIVEWFCPDVLIGGFHFMKLDPESGGLSALEDAARQLLRYPTTYYTGHCTGQAQFRVMKAIMGDRLHSLSTGTKITV